MGPGPPRAPGSLKSLLAAQLGTCIAALKAGNQDQILRMSSFVSAPSYFMFILFFLSTALSGGHDVWHAVFEMVKNVSEVMMSTLPNFWKIAKGFLGGKYKKVRFHCFPRSTVYQLPDRGDIEPAHGRFTTKSISSSDHGSRYHQALRIPPFRILRLFGYGSDDAARRRKLYAIFT